MEDLVECGLKSEEDVVGILNECFQRQQYYIDVGDVLVTVNPWTSLEQFENEVVDFSRFYKSKDKHYPLPPHPCSVAEKAVRNCSDGVIIPLGESGSGKSSNVRMILQYLTLRCHVQEKFSKDQVLTINEVLDILCNARTLICNNSTRCFKVYEVFFDSKEQRVLGVNVKVNVLEKMRVISQIKGESNFHIFHRLLNELSSEKLEEYFLDGNHRYVPLLPKEAFCENDNFLIPQSLKCLEKLGFNEKEMEEVLHLVSAILLLGDLQFGKSDKRDVLAFQNGEVLEKAAGLFGISCATLANLIITDSKTVRGRKVNISASCSKAMYECDRMAITCYETLVTFIEERINSKCNGYSRLQSDFSILLLDVFGWENYNICSFDQLCINTVNEVLQSVYNAIVFTTYQTDMEREDIYLNESCQKFDQPGAVPLLLKPKGLFDVLHSNTDSDQNLLKKCDSLFKKEPRYITNINQEFSGFLIEHFIGEVLYDISGFAAQSKNSFNNNVLTCLKDSKNKLISTMVQERMTRENTSMEKNLSSPSSSKKHSVVKKDWLKTNIFLAHSGKEKKKHDSIKNSNAAVLTMSLTSLLDQISSSKIYFIRCINSNLRMQPGVFDCERALRQVQCSKLYGTIKTRLPCLKSCFSLSEFVNRYQFLFFYLTSPVSPSPELCHSVLSKRFDESRYRAGKTKVFLSKSLVLELNEMLEKAIHQVILIQKVYRGRLARKQYQAMIKIKNKYDNQRLLFLSQITDGISKFHDHLSLQISEDQRRFKQSKLKGKQLKSETNENNDTGNNPATPSPSSAGSRTFYVWDDKVIIDETSESSTWCKIVCFQRTQQMAVFSIKDPKVVINGSNQSFTTDRIGFNLFPTPSQDKQMKKVKACIGRGVELYLATDGSLMAVRQSKNPIFVKGHFCEDRLLQTLGELFKHEESKLFDYRSFIEKINYECHPARLAIDSEDRCLAMCVVYLCFVKNSVNDNDCPCWVEVVLTRAVQYVKDAVSLSMQRRREVQEKYHFQEPPALRIDSQMELTSAKILKLIRPSRYIETMKFKRKAWARKRVVSNPFLFGEVSLSEDDRSVSVSSPESSFAEETGFESNEKVCNSPKNGEQVFYENVRNMPRSHDNAFSPDNSFVEQSESKEIVFTLPAHERQNLYENVKVETRQTFFKTQVESGDLSDNLKEDGNKKREVQINSLSENAGQDLDEHAESQRRKVIEVQSYGQNETKQMNDVVSQSGLYSNQSLTSMGPDTMMVKGMTDVNIPEKLENTSQNHTEDMYVNAKSYITSSCKSNQEISSRLKHVEEVHIDPSRRVYLSSQVFQGKESTTRKSLNGVPEPSGIKQSDIQHDFPCPDYMDNDPVYTNLDQMQKDDENEDVYEVMNRVSHHEMVYHGEEQYVNSAFFQQQKSQTEMTPSVDFSGEELSQGLVKHRMSFPRP